MILKLLSSTTSFFSDTQTLEMQWIKLWNMFNTSCVKKNTVGLPCFNIKPNYYKPQYTILSHTFFFYNNALIHTYWFIFAIYKKVLLRHAAEKLRPDSQIWDELKTNQCVSIISVNWQKPCLFWNVLLKRALTEQRRKLSGPLKTCVCFSFHSVLVTCPFFQLNVASDASSHPA